MVTRRRVRGPYAKGLDCRDALVRAAVRLVAERGVDGASVEAVAQAAGVTKGAAYWHFANKGALLAAAGERALEAWTTDVLRGVLGVPSEADRVKWVISAHVAQLPRPGSPAAYLGHAVAGGPASAAILRKWRARVQQVAGLSIGTPGGVPHAARRVTEALLAALLGLGIHWAAARDRVALERAAAGFAAGLASQVTGGAADTHTYQQVLI